MDIVRFLRISASAAACMVAAFLCVSCDKDGDFGIDGSMEGINHEFPGNRIAHKETRRVVIFYECGFNSLYTYLSDDMNKELPEGYLPGKGRNNDVVLVFSKLARNGSYKDVPSYLRRLYRDGNGEVVSDTLVTYPSSTVATSGATMNEVLSYVKTNFPAKGYGLIFASHGSGWLPEGYYNNPTEFEREHWYGVSGRKYSKSMFQEDIPEGDMEKDDPYYGMVRSLGQDRMSDKDHEMDVSEFVSGIPFHLDYLLFDACLSSGLEVIYPLRNKADYIGASPAEVLADGMYDYSKLVSYLLEGPSSPDLKNLFIDSFNRYDKQSGGYRSSTVTLVRTSGLDRLASVCKDLVTKYSVEIAHAPVNKIQVYFRKNRHYFYDLEDTFAQCGASKEDLATLRSAIDGCIVYKNATPSMLDSFEIRTYSGFSIYLPCNGSTLLNSYFKEEEWNKAVGLVN